MTQVSVSNLPFFLTDEDFLDLCNMTNEKVISAIIKVYPNSVQSTGTGIAIFETELAAKNAVNFFNDKLVNDREIFAEIITRPTVELPQRNTTKDSQQSLTSLPNSNGESISSGMLLDNELASTKHFLIESMKTVSKRDDEIVTSSSSSSASSASSSCCSVLSGSTEKKNCKNEAKSQESCYQSIQSIPMFPNEFSNSVPMGEQLFATKLYAGNLSPQVTEADLRDVFYGHKVVAISVFPSHDPLSRVNHAIIEFSSAKEAQKALEEIAGTILDDFLIDLQPIGDDLREYMSPLSEDGELLYPCYLTISPPPSVTPPLTLSSLEPILRNDDKEVEQSNGEEGIEQRKDDNFPEKSFSYPERAISSSLQCNDVHRNQHNVFSRSDGLQWQSIPAEHVRRGPNACAWSRRGRALATPWSDLSRSVDPKTVLFTNLPRSTTEADLLEAVKGYKTISAKVFIKAVTGFGFVVFEDAHDASEVVGKRQMKVGDKMVPVKQGYRRVE